ncbi:MAG: GAF domain-containing sensor histidine kinase [Chloroflexota bacterium]
MPPPTHPRQLFRLLLLYRWLGLVPPLIALLVGSFSWLLLGVLLTAVSLTTLITLFSTQLNQQWQARPWLLLLDLLLIAAFLASSGGWQSPYTLYAFSPLIAAGLFFQLRGALLATTAWLPLYLGAVMLAPPVNWLTTTINLIGFYLISGSFGYAALLLTRLRHSDDALADSHRDLELIHDLTASLHTAANVDEVQTQFLTALITQFGCEQALLGLVDPETDTISSWLGQQRAGDEVLPHIAHLSLDEPTVMAALQSEQPLRLTTPLPLPWQMGNGLLLPLLWGRQPVGVVLLALPDEADSPTRLHLLMALARQTAVVLGMMQTRLRRAKETAVQTERARIALDIHDTVSQSLFGLVFTLDGSLKLLDKNPQAIRPELEWALQMAEEVRQNIRQFIHDLWQEEMSAQAFETDLRRYAADILQANNLLVQFDIRGDFTALSPRAQRSLYRICQESLTNIVHHAAASEARICVDVENGVARLSVRDNGQGFEPEIALARDYGDEHFGLRGMIERSRSLGGSCDIFSQPAAGTSIVIEIPAGGTA